DLSSVRAPGRSQSPHSTAAVMSREKHGKQSRAEGRWAGRWMRERRIEAQRASAMSIKTTQGAESRKRPPWSWAEASVRTERMVSAQVTASKNRKVRGTDQHGPRLSRLRTNQAARFTARVVARYSRSGNHRLESRMRENRLYGSEGGQPSRPLSDAAQNPARMISLVHAVIPAKAGTHRYPHMGVSSVTRHVEEWVPAFAGMTGVERCFARSEGGEGARASRPL